MARYRILAIPMVFAIVASLFSMGTTLGASSRPTPCGPGEVETSLPMPPQGMVSYQEITFTKDCDLIIGPIETLPRDQLPPATAEASGTFGTVGEQLQGEGSASAYSEYGCCYKGYAVQRTWDQGGRPGAILLNEYWTEFSFNRCSGGFCSPYIRTWGAQDGGKWHREGPLGCCGGWDPNTSDHWLYRTAGGLGYTSVSISGHQGYKYNGFFDHTGNDYYNWYTNNFTGQYGGGWTCSLTYYWKKSLGFSLQRWCDPGTYGEK